MPIYSTDRRTGKKYTIYQCIPYLRGSKNRAETEVIIGPICQSTEDTFAPPKELVSHFFIAQIWKYFLTRRSRSLKQDILTGVILGIGRVTRVHWHGQHDELHVRRARTAQIRQDVGGRRQSAQKTRCHCIDWLCRGRQIHCLHSQTGKHHLFATKYAQYLTVLISMLNLVLRRAALVALPEMLRSRAPRWRWHYAQWSVVRPALVHSEYLLMSATRL